MLPCYFYINQRKYIVLESESVELWKHISEIIQNEKTGILIPPENEQEMINAINNLIKNNSLIEIMTKNAFNFINKFYSWDTLLPKYVELYEK